MITRNNVDKYLLDYDYDGTMYLQKDCSTCVLKKPARSKHCCEFVCLFVCLIVKLFVLFFFLTHSSDKYQAGALRPLSSGFLLSTYLPISLW